MNTTITHAMLQAAYDTALRLGKGSKMRVDMDGVTLPLTAARDMIGKRYIIADKWVKLPGCTAEHDNKQELEVFAKRGCVVCGKKLKHKLTDETDEICSDACFDIFSQWPIAKVKSMTNIPYIDRLENPVYLSNVNHLPIEP